MRSGANPTRLRERLNQRITDQSVAALDACAWLCAERDLSLFLVGGAVRDLVLQRETIDLDLAVEGEVEEIAQELAKPLGARAVFHSRFGTATVSGAGFQLDLARTRRERYERPGALPAVEPASLADDLARRDFTVNTLALRLTEPAGELIDPFGGMEDIESRLVRVLHERSFQDDATRILRAARYAGRLGFQIETLTEAWLRRDLAFFDTVSGPRLRRELSLMFREEGAVEESELAARLGALEAVHPALRLPNGVATRWRDALRGTHYASLDELGFCVVADLKIEESVQSLSQRLHLAGRIEGALLDLVRLQRLSTKLAASRGSAVEVVELLDGHAAAAVWALAVREGGDVARACYVYLGEWRRVRPFLRGNDLLALGIPQGKAVGEMLTKLRRARLEGRTRTREDEVDLVRAEVQGT
jgi:tRNA nucleotidyltransferase (CCA-adding enzyme)